MELEKRQELHPKVAATNNEKNDKMKSSTSSLAGLDPLKDLLSEVLTRLDALENAVGKAGSPPRGISSRALGSSSQHTGPQPAKIASTGECQY